MNIDLFLADLPLWLSFPLIVVLPTVLTVSALVFLRRRLPIERLQQNHDVATFTFASVSVIYAVLLGFAVIVVWERFHDAENAAMQEAGSVVAVYRLCDGLGDAGGELRSKLTAYVKSVIDEDWPAMAHGKGSAAAIRALNDVYAAALKADPAGDRAPAVVLAEIFHQLDQITQARRERIVSGGGVVPGMVWAVLVVGGVITVASAFFFGTENLRAQLLMTAS